MLNAAALTVIHLIVKVSVMQCCRDEAEIISHYALLLFYLSKSEQFELYRSQVFAQLPDASI